MFTWRSVFCSFHHITSKYCPQGALFGRDFGLKPRTHSCRRVSHARVSRRFRFLSKMPEHQNHKSSAKQCKSKREGRGGHPCCTLWYYIASTVFYILIGKACRAFRCLSVWFRFGCRLRQRFYMILL